MNAPKVTRQAVRDVYKLALLGATHAELADFFDITEGQLTKWISDVHPFSKSMKLGKMKADSNVVRSMYKRACGYEYKEERAFSYMGDVEVVVINKHMPADVNAGKFWLKNRQADKWREQPQETQTAFHEPWEIEYTDED